MLLVKAHVENFRSIDDSGEVAIDPQVTALVGLNESGKTAFLNALDLSYSTRPIATSRARPSTSTAARPTPNRPWRPGCATA